MRVLIISEDPTLDQHILKPIVEQIFLDIGRTARVDILRDPHVTGAEQALDSALIDEVVIDNPMIDLFLLIADRDCNRKGHESKVTARQKEHPEKLLAALAWQEIEVWAMALHRESLAVAWNDVRVDCDRKESFWDPFIEQKRWVDTVGKGRKKAMRGMGAKWSALLAVCPELKDFRDRVRAHVGAGT